jgi:Arc/MetJ-type ribon-helix-helix transcriptional regulator
MHTITLKSDDNFYEMLNEMVKSLNTTKSDLIRKAVSYYKEMMEKEKLKKQIVNASLKTRSSLVEEIKDFDGTSNDGLADV